MRNYYQEPTIATVAIDYSNSQHWHIADNQSIVINMNMLELRAFTKLQVAAYDMLSKITCKSVNDWIKVSTSEIKPIDIELVLHLLIDTKPIVKKFKIADVIESSKTFLTIYELSDSFKGQKLSSLPNSTIEMNTSVDSNMQILIRTANSKQHRCSMLKFVMYKDSNIQHD